MTITGYPSLSTVPGLRAASNSTPAQVGSLPEPTESFTRSKFGDDVKGTLVLGAIAAVGAGIGVYAGLGTGVLAGLAGAISGATGGASAAAHLPGQHIKAGALVGAIGGAILGASYSSPILAGAMGLSGATLPYGAILAIFSGAE